MLNSREVNEIRCDCQGTGDRGPKVTQIQPCLRKGAVPIRHQNDANVKNRGNTNNWQGT